MPSKPKKPCAYPGCPNLTDGRYCPEHQQKVNSNYEKYGRDDCEIIGLNQKTTQIRGFRRLSPISLTRKNRKHL